MKKVLSIVLVLLTCCFTMAFFTGCDKNPYVIRLSGVRKVYTQIDKNLPLLERFDIIDEYLKEITLTVYYEEVFDDGEVGSGYHSFEYYRYDLPKVKNEKTGEMEHPKEVARGGEINLYMAKLNGASGATLELDSPGKKVMNVSFMGATTTFEYTVEARSN